MAPTLALQPPSSAPGESLAEARELLRRAARLPYHARRADAWARRFRRLAADASAAIAHHVVRFERSTALGYEIAGHAPRLIPAMARQSEAHLDLIRASFDLVHEAEAVQRPDIWNMVELGEQAMRLSIAVERHHNRLLNLATEADRDLGGAG